MKKSAVCTLHQLSSNRIMKSEIGWECSKYGTNVRSIYNFVLKFELKRNRDSLVDIVTLSYNSNDQGSEIWFLKGRRNFSFILNAQTYGALPPLPRMPS